MNVTCPHCSAAFHASADLYGRQAQCPNCANAFNIPIPAQQTPAVPSTPQPAQERTPNQPIAPVKRPGPANERSYRHRICQAETIVTDKHLVGICNPTVFVAKTYCTHCQDDFPLSDFQWADTGEPVESFRARMMQLVPESLRSLNQHMLWIPWVAGLVVAGLLALVLPSPKMKIGGAVGGLIFVGFLLTQIKTLIMSGMLKEDFHEYQ